MSSISHPLATGYSYVGTKAARERVEAIKQKRAEIAAAAEAAAAARPRTVSDGQSSSALPVEELLDGRRAISAIGGERSSSVGGGNMPNDRELQSLIKAQRDREQRMGSPPGGLTKAHEGKDEGKSPNVTVYHTTYNVKEDHPEMFAK